MMPKPGEYTSIPGTCDQNAACINKFGGYECKCPEGYHDFYGDGTYCPGPFCDSDDSAKPWLSRDPYPKNADCELPKCDAELEILDTWMAPRGKKKGVYRYGFAARITVPDDSDYSVLLQFSNKARGNFMTWNAAFFNSYNNPEGHGVLLHKQSMMTDTKDKSSFVLIGDNMRTDELRKLNIKFYFVQLGLRFKVFTF